MDKTIQSITGTVVKVGSVQTIKIATKVTKVHPIYRKRYTLTKHLTAHDTDSIAKVGDVVTVIPCRPISKTKRWAVQSKAN